MNFDADCCESLETLCGLVLPPGVWHVAVTQQGADFAHHLLTNRFNDRVVTAWFHYIQWIRADWKTPTRAPASWTGLTGLREMETCKRSLFFSLRLLRESPDLRTTRHRFTQPYTQRAGSLNMPSQQTNRRTSQRTFHFFLIVLLVRNAIWLQYWWWVKLDMQPKWIRAGANWI